MKMYRVETPPQVNAQIDDQVEHYRDEEASEQVIIGWLSGLLDAIDSLEQLPLRFPVDPDRTAIRRYEVRRFNYGEFGIFYRVHEDRRVVEILDLRHGRRRPGHEDEMDSPEAS